MYSKTEIEKIFESSSNWDELQLICDGFIYLMRHDDEYCNNKMVQALIQNNANIAFRRIENLML